MGQVHRMATSMIKMNEELIKVELSLFSLAQWRLRNNTFEQQISRKKSLSCQSSPFNLMG